MNGGLDMRGARRPVAARGLRVLETLTRRLAARGVSPNAISLLGLLCGLGAGLCFASTLVEPRLARLAWLAGALLVLLRTAANLLDGMVAVAHGRANPTGPLWNEVPDRVSDAAMLVGLGLGAGGALALGFAAAWAAAMVAYVRVQAAVAGAPQDYAGPMAKPQRIGLVVLTAVYQALAPSAWQDAVRLPTIVLGVIVAGCLLTCGRRLQRASRRLGESAS